MKQKKQTIEVFNFWKDNKIDKHFQLSKVELLNRFQNWLPTKEKDWLNYYSSDRIIRHFIAIDEHGLRSVFEEKEYTAIYNLLQPNI